MAKNWTLDAADVATEQMLGLQGEQPYISQEYGRPGIGFPKVVKRITSFYVELPPDEDLIADDYYLQLEAEGSEKEFVMAQLFANSKAGVVEVGRVVTKGKDITWQRLSVPLKAGLGRLTDERIKITLASNQLAKSPYFITAARCICPPRPPIGPVKEEPVLDLDPFLPDPFEPPDFFNQKQVSG